jgi:hypothetical protein
MRLSNLIAKVENATVSLVTEVKADFEAAKVRRLMRQMDIVEKAIQAKYGNTLFIPLNEFTVNAVIEAAERDAK